MLQMLTELKRNILYAKADTEFDRWLLNVMSSSSSNSSQLNSDDETNSSFNLMSSTSSNSPSEDDDYFDTDIISTEIINQYNKNEDENSYESIITIFSSILGCSIMELDTICTSLLDLTVITRRDWAKVQITISSPKQNRTIAELGDTNCYSYTRFRSSELMVLYNLFCSGRRKNTYTFKNVSLPTKKH